MQCAVEHSLRAGAAVSLLIKEKQTGPGNVTAVDPASGCVIKSHRASLRHPGNKGMGHWMPSHHPPTTLLPPSSSTGAKPEPRTGGGEEQKCQHTLTHTVRKPFGECTPLHYVHGLLFVPKQKSKYTSHEHDSSVRIHKARQRVTI